MSAVRIDKVFRDPGPSTALVPAMPVPDIADRRHRFAGHQAADAAVVPRHASAWPGQEGNIQHRVGPAAGDLDQRCLAASAQADAGHARARPSLQARRRRPADRDRRRFTSAASAPAKGLGAAGAATPLLLSRSRPPMTVGRYTLACRWCVASEPVKPSVCAPLSRPEPPLSATAASGFAASPNSRASSINGTSPAPVAGRRATLPSAGRTRCWPMSKTASWPPIAWSAPNICHVTSPPSPGASTAALF